MQFVNDMQKKVQEFASENATTLLTAGGVVGTVATAVLAGRTGYKVALILKEAEYKRNHDEHGDRIDDDTDPIRPMTTLEKAQVTGIYFVPPVIAGSATITAIIFANRMSSSKAAALAAAYGLTQKQFEEYKEKVAEKLTGPKQDQVNAELAQERANRTAGAGQFVIIEGGDVLCFDESGGRYFKSSMEKLKRAENKVNEEILHCSPVSLNEFYDQLGLPPTTFGDAVGFNSDNLLELDIKAILSPEDEKTPCLAIDFKRVPRADYTGHHQ